MYVLLQGIMFNGGKLRQTVKGEMFLCFLLHGIPG